MAALGVEIRHHLTMRLDAVEGMRERLQDFRPVWLGGVQPIVTDYLLKRFATEGAHLGAKWAGHAPVTRELRKQSGRGRGGIGRDTNRMWASFTKSAGSQAAPGGVLRIDPLRYERGSTVPYARFFHRGIMSTHLPVYSKALRAWTGKRRRTPKLVPARPIFGTVGVGASERLPAALMMDIEAVVRRYVATGEVGA